MGDRAVIKFKETSSSPAISLYMHWGGSTQHEKLAAALEAARPRWNDHSYATRICISQIIGSEWRDVLGYGIGVDDSVSMGDYNYVPVVIWDEELVRIESGYKSVSLTFDDYIERVDLGIVSEHLGESLLALRF